MKREVVAGIRLDALRHNLGVVRRLCPSSRIVAMVKANAYGHGLLPVAEALSAAGVDALGVAVIDEALALRAAGISAPVIVMEGAFSTDEVAAAAARDIALVVYRDEQVAMLCDGGADVSGLEVWLKIETGMHRLGLPAAQADVAVEKLRSRVRRLGVMTHFACADEAGHPLTPVQLDLLKRFAQRHALPASAANSGAIVACPAARLDDVRPGIMLYGGAPVIGQDAAAFGLQPVMTLSARVIAVNDVPEGEAVGYGCTWRAARDSRIAVVGIGYGDGYPRHAPSGTPVLVGGHRRPLAGRVSMDMITVDVTGLPGVGVGDPVVLWGEGLPADEVARNVGTISYELFCRLTSRVRFVYAR
ncbi:MAG: alanine racemase [Gammaproteobacteria bacterium]